MILDRRGDAVVNLFLRFDVDPDAKAARDLPSLAGLAKVRLDQLEIGDRWLQYSPACNGWPELLYSGTCLWVGTGSVEVLLDGTKQAKDSERFAPEVEVYKLPSEAVEVQLRMEIERMAQAKKAAAAKLKVAPKAANVTKVAPNEATDTPVTEAVANGTAAAAVVDGNNPKVKALFTRYNFWQQKLANPTDDAQVEAAMDAISKIEAEAGKLGIDLTAAPPAAAPVPTLTPAQKQSAAMVKREAAIANHKATTSTAAPRVKKAVTLAPCLDGCGAEVKGKFLPGHDAKLKSLIGKIERGEEPKDALPEIVQGIVKFVKGELVVERDANNKVVSSTQNYVCTAAPVKMPGREDFTVTEREAAE